MVRNEPQYLLNEFLRHYTRSVVKISKRFLPNAAWGRSNILTYNILSVMKRRVGPQSGWSLRLKTLRFHLLGIAGRIIEHGRRRFVKTP